MMRKINETGRSMVEMMGYMAVMMTVIVAVGKMVTNIFDEYKTSQAVSQLSDLAAAISKAGAMEKDYSDVDFSKYIPPSYRIVEGSSETKIFHVLGGEVKIAVQEGEEDKFSVTFSGLRRKQCIELAMKDWRLNQNVDLYAIGVNNNFFYWPVYVSADEPKDGPFGFLPMTRIMLAGKSDSDTGLCFSENEGNAITWIFN